MASTTSFERKGLRFGMESSPASAEVKGSMQAEEEERRKRKQREKDRKGWRGRGGRQSQTTTREGGHAEQVNKVHRHRCGGSLPAHAVATGSPVEPGCMEGWKVDGRSNRLLCIFTALQAGKKDVFRLLHTALLWLKG